MLEQFDIISLCESKLDPSVTDCSITPTNYTCYRFDRNGHGGGVICYCKQNLPSEQLLELQSKYNRKGIETVCCKIAVSNSSIIVICVYRPPSTDLTWFLELQNLLLDGKELGNVVLLGDLNANLMDKQINPGKTLVEVMENTNLQLNNILTPTRVTRDSATCLDLIAFDPELHYSNYVVLDIAASDHCPVSAKVLIAVITSRLKPVMKRSWKHADFEEIKLRLNRQVLNNVEYSNTDLLINDWYTGVNEILDELAPVKAMPFRVQRSPFMTPDIKDLIQMRDRLLRKSKRNSLADEEWNELKLLKRKVTSQLRAERKAQGKSALTSNRSDQAWKFIRQATFSTKSKQSSSPISVVELNSFFADTVYDPSKQISPIHTCHPIDSFSFTTVDESSVYSVLNRVDRKAAAGHDGFSGHFIHFFAAALTINVTYLFNHCIENNNFPSIWKKANITAIWKNKGSKKDVTNYRPISVLPILGRSLEKILAAQLGEYCETNKFIPSSQIGFRKASNCESALIKATDSWMAQVDQGKIVGALLIDLSKAFDSVGHQQLLLDLQTLNLQ